MEKSLTEKIEQIAASSGVLGVVCADAKGMALYAQGNLKTDAAPVVSELARLAGALEPQNKEKPQVVLHLEHSEVLVVSQDENVTLAVRRKE